MLGFGSLSLKWKVLLGVTVTSVLAVVVSSVVFVRMEIDRLHDTIQTDSVTLARVLGGNVAGALAFYDDASAFQALSSLAATDRVDAAVIYGDDGAPFAWFRRGGERGDSLPAGLPGSAQSSGISESGGYLHVFEPITSDGEAVGTIYLQVNLDELNAVIGEAVTSAVITVLAMALLAAGMSWLVQAAIVKPINRVADALKDIAEGDGDLSQRLPVATNDEVGRLARWFNTFIEKIQTIITDFAGTATELAGAAEQLRHTAKDTERGMTGQQAEIDQVVTAVREMAAVVTDVAANVADTAENAEYADKDSRAGRQVVVNTLSQIESLANDVETASEVIGRLRQETENIGTVLDVIRGIAEQTNLLALNAAIEAARAGEQGRGFAVVADEVRTLASRTQSSTQEIQEMIERLQQGAKEAVTMMEKGTTQGRETVKQGEDASSSLEAITGRVTQIKDKTNQIASATEEQTASTREIERNMETIAGVAQQTAGGATEIAAATAELASMAAKMEQLVGQFKLR